MKIRIKFSKHGNTKYVGHLDIMRYFQKAMRRADIPIKYSEGFSPHQIMSFAAPLGLGIESDSEYLDIETNQDIDPGQAIESLNSVMCEGIRILEWKKLDDKAKKAMSMVNSADYLVICDCKDISVLYKNEIIINKKSKNGEDKEVDIKSMIYSVAKVPEGLLMHLAQGSEANLKPDTVMGVLGIEDYHVIRKAIYDANGLTL